MQAIEKLNNTQPGHWTTSSPVRMVRSVSSDFVIQVENLMEQSGCNNVELAKRLGVTLGRVSQMLNSPGNFTLRNGILYAGALGNNVAMVLYPADVRSAPVSGDVFRACWEIAGRPVNMFDIQENTVLHANTNGGLIFTGHCWGNAPVNLGGGTIIGTNNTAQTDYKQRLMKPVPLDAQSV